MPRHGEEGQSEQSYSRNIRNLAQVQDRYLRNPYGSKNIANLYNR
jgi:hypothetical protein